MKGLLRALAIVLASLGWIPAAMAQDGTPPDRFSFGVGVYQASSDTTVAAHLRGLPVGASVHLEDDLGFNDSGAALRLRARMRVGERQELSVDYYRFGRASQVRWDAQAPWQGRVHHSRGDLHGRLRFAFGGVAWRWWFGEVGNEIGVGLGAGYYRAQATVTGVASLDGVDHVLDEQIQAQAWAPLLQVGWRRVLGRRWRAYFSAAGVFKSGGRLQGHIYNARLGVRWLPTRHLGVALEYGLNSIHIRKLHQGWRDGLDLELSGPSVFVSWRY